MADDVAIVSLSVPAEAAYARAVRMMAANLAVVCDMSVEGVEDTRLAAGEGFVYACATEPASCDITFTLNAGELRMTFTLGTATPEASMLADIDLMELMLEAVCDDFGVSDDGSVLSIIKRGDASYVE